MASVKGKHKAGTQNVEVRLHKRHPGQVAIAQHPARFRVVMCGRRWGKSACGIREACDAAIAGQPVGWFAPTYKLALEYGVSLPTLWYAVTRRTWKHVA